MSVYLESKMDNDFLLKNFNEEKRRRFTSVSSVNRPRDESFNADALSSSNAKNSQHLDANEDDFFRDRNHTFHLLSIASLSSQRSRRSRKSFSRKTSAKHSSRNRSHTSYIPDSENTGNGQSDHHSTSQSPTAVSPSNSPQPDDNDRSQRHRRASHRRSPTKSRNHGNRGK